MTTLSLREAAEQAGTSKSTIFRAIKAGRLSAARTEDGGFAIDPAELFRVYKPKELAVAADHATQRTRGQGATPAGTRVEQAETAAIQLAMLEAEIKGLKELLAEVRQSRDEWRDQASRITNALPDLSVKGEPSSWWRRLAG